jgi:gamma-glutamylcyclotransferase (GGCT)/AIG2-like uncharacterized protein YtfP
MKRNRLYIAYGSNLNLPQMAMRCPSARVVGATLMRNWRLLFRGAREGAVATREPCRGESVPVLVWAITPQDEAALDRYEGWPYLYRKESVRVTLNGKQVRAMVYIMNEGRPLGEPSPRYFVTILDGYLTAGFDPDVLVKATEDSAEIQ